MVLPQHYVKETDRGGFWIGSFLAEKRRLINHHLDQPGLVWAVLSLKHQKPVRSQQTDGYIFVDVRAFQKWSTANLYFE